MTLRQILEVFGTNSRKVGDLGISEDFLARFHSDHEFKSPLILESFAFQEFGRRKGRLMHGSHKNPFRLIQDLSSCPKEPRLERPR